jgi:hypothetical protein
MYQCPSKAGATSSSQSVRVRKGRESVLSCTSHDDLKGKQGVEACMTQCMSECKLL